LLVNKPSVDTKQQTEILLNPWFIPGFTDAEGSFMIIVSKKSGTRSGWWVGVRFQIVLHKRDEELLKLIQTYFGGIGLITIAKRGECQFTVNSLDQILKKIVPHFEKYPLKTQKLTNYLLFKQVVMMMERKEHVKNESLQAIVNIRATINSGLTPTLKAAFPNTIQITRPVVENQKISDPQWMAGFTSGEGCFLISISKSPADQLGVKVKLRFKLVQHYRDEKLLISFSGYFSCGKYYPNMKTGVGEFLVEKFSDIDEKIIPFFLKYKITGVKFRDFQDWCKAAEIIKKKDHLTTEGLEQLRELKLGMNRGRSVEPLKKVG